MRVLLDDVFEAFLDEACHCRMSCSDATLTKTIEGIKLMEEGRRRKAEL